MLFGEKCGKSQESKRCDSLNPSYSTNSMSLPSDNCLGAAVVETCLWEQNTGNSHMSTCSLSKEWTYKM